jgi:hypothetical protein
MAKVNFAPASEPVTPVKATATVEAEAAYEGSSAVAANPRQAVAVGEMYGEFDPRDFKPPRLTLAQGSGELTKIHTEGTWLLSEIELATPKAGRSEPLLEIVLAGFVKFWEAPRAYNPDDKTMAPRFYHRQEVLDAGLTLDWGKNPNGGKDLQPTAKSCADILVLVKQPTPETPGFGLEIEGVNWCPALWTVRHTAYHSVAKPILSAVQYQYGGKLLTCVWQLWARRKQMGQYNPFVPEVRQLAGTTLAWRQAAVEAMPKAASTDVPNV